MPGVPKHVGNIINGAFYDTSRKDVILFKIRVPCERSHALKKIAFTYIT